MTGYVNSGVTPDGMMPNGGEYGAQARYCQQVVDELRKLVIKIKGNSATPNLISKANRLDSMLDGVERNTLIKPQTLKGMLEGDKLYLEPIAKHLNYDLAQLLNGLDQMPTA